MTHTERITVCLNLNLAMMKEKEWGGRIIGRSNSQEVFQNQFQTPIITLVNIRYY